MPIRKGLRAPRAMPRPRGEANKASKLTEEDIRGIRLMYAVGNEGGPNDNLPKYSLGYIAKCYSNFKGFRISKQQIHRIVNRTQWTHVKDRFVWGETAPSPPAEAAENKSVENAQTL